jgi:serine/threonine protein kinase
MNVNRNGVLHRDIKPDNFLIISLSAKAPVSCKIADFGTSRYSLPSLPPGYTTRADTLG